MTTTTGSTSENNYEQLIMGKDDIAILKAEIATLKENIEILGETLNQNNVVMLAQDAEIDDLKAEIIRLSERPSSLFPSLSCTYRFTNDFEEEVYETECGNSLVFFDGGPRENEYKYCPFCGKVIIVMTIETKDDGGQEE